MSGSAPHVRDTTVGLVRRARSLVRLPAMAGRAMLELAFPSRCVACGCDLSTEGATESRLPMCDRCVAQLAVFAGPTCRQCGASVPTSVGAVDRCVHCRGGNKLWFDHTVALGPYGGYLRELLLRMKGEAGNSISLALGELVWQRRRERLAALQVDLVVPVPMHWRRRFSHGTNPTELMAEVLSRRLGVRLARRALRRRRNTPPQFSLPPTRRWPNVRRAFAVRRGYPILGRRALLVDDIMTTGATCSEAARTLKKAGAESVSVVVAARTLSG